MTSIVLSVFILGCSSQRKVASNKDIPPVSSRENADSVFTLLSSLDGPLIIMDGTEISVHVLADMSVEDIKEFSIYKDADAIKLYGTRGSKGVIDIKSNLSEKELKKRIKKHDKKRKSPH